MLFCGAEFLAGDVELRRPSTSRYRRATLRACFRARSHVASQFADERQNLVCRGFEPFKVFLESRSIVIKAIDDLVDRGFILKSAQPHVGRIIGKRTVFQRPAPEFTLLRLFELKLIDSDLHPLATAADRQQSQKRETLARASDDVVKAGLRRLVGDEMFQVYSQMRTEERRLRALVDRLNSSLEASRSAELDKRTAERIKKLFRPKDLSAELEQLILEEEAEQEAEREPVPF